jgi:hypothetical protein
MTERFVLSFGAGAALLSALVFGLCAAGLARAPWLFAALVLAALPLMYFRIPGSPRHESARYGAATVRERALFWIVVVPFALVYLANAAAPEISPDGAGYHLGLVRSYFHHGGFSRITTDLFASFPQGCEMLFLVAYAAGRHSAAALVHCSFLLALPAAMISYGRRFGLGPAATLAALLVFVSPVVGIDGSSAYVDVALAFAGFACFYCLEIWADQPGHGTRMLVVAGLMAGFAFSVKYTGAAVIAFAAIYVAIRGRQSGPRLWRPMVALLLPAFLMAAPWLIKNWIFVDNPVSPFFNRLFPNPYVYISFEDDLRRAMRHMNGVAINLKTALELTVRGGLLQGTLGPVFLLAPIGLIAAVDARGRRVLGAVAFLGLPWFSNIGTRFLIPALPFVALSICIALKSRPRIAAAIVVMNAIACWPWVLERYCDPFNWRLTRFPVAAALRITPEGEFLAANAPDVRFAQLLQDRVPENGVVYTAQPIMRAYTDRTILLNYAAALNLRLSDTLLTAIKPANQPSVQVSFRFPPRELRRIRFVATGESEVWSVHEIQLDAGHVTASANVWDARFAIDGQLATSWRSWQPVRPGMYLEVSLPPGNETGFVSFRTRPGDPLPPLTLDAQLPSGEWRTLSSSPVLKTDIPVLDLRSQAMAELRRCGVTHVLIHDDEPLGPDFKTHQAEWNVRLAGEALPVRLYSILAEVSIDRTRELRNNTR